ncbi:MAG: FMN-binding protein [Spirochaetaceae bacterium]|jgi:electron transport complex protein RnfG|nr:FMN-binding protein [Spirochaetaceae bacterium]
MKIGPMFKLGVILAAFATAACVGLAFVYAGTAEVIAVRAKADLEAALKDLFPLADDFRAVSAPLESGVSTVTFDAAYDIYRDGALIGVVIRVTGPGFNGPIVTLTGVRADGTLAGAKILEHTDTPGLGANAASPKYFVDKAKGLTFMGQYAGKSVTDAFEVRADIIPITAATITSRGLSGAVRAAGKAGSAYLAARGGK